MALLRRGHFSATCIGLAVMAGTAWVQAHVTLLALHDDGAIVHAAATTLDRPAVRAGLKTVLDAAVVRTAEAAGTDVSANPAVGVLTSALTSESAITGTVDEWTGVLLQVRDQVVAQVEADTVTGPLVVDLAPVLTAANVTVPEGLDQVLPTGGEGLHLQVASAAELAQLQQRYRWEVFQDRWFGLAGLVLLVVGVLASRRRVRTITIAAGATLVLAVLAEPILGWVVGKVTGNEWGPVLRPLLDEGTTQVTPIAATVAWASAGIAVCGVLWMSRHWLSDRLSRRAAPAGAAPDEAAAPLAPPAEPPAPASPSPGIDA